MIYQQIQTQLFIILILTAMYSDDQQYMDVADEFSEAPIQKTTCSNTNNDHQGSRRKLTNGLSTYDAIKKLHQKNIGRKKLDKNDIKQCTFQPNINRKDSKERKRSFKKFIDDQNNYQTIKESKIQSKRDEMVRSEATQLTCRPTVDRNSNRIANDLCRMKGQQVFDRLSKQKKISVNINEETLFSPKILSRSKQMTRKQKVSSLLYSDARRRQQKQKFIANQHIHKRQATPSINKNSSKYATKKIYSEFTELVQYSQERISAIMAISVISQIFNVDLNPNRSSDKEQLCHKVLTFLVDKGEEEDVQINRLWNFIQIVMNCSTSTLHFSQLEQDQISNCFSFFYVNRLAKERKAKTPERYSFNPSTLEKSTRLASRHRERVLTEINEFVSNQNVKICSSEEMKIQDLFLADHMKKKLLLQDRKRELENQQLQLCTFKPKTNHTSSTSKIAKSNNNRMSIKIMDKIKKPQKSDFSNELGTFNNSVEKTIVEKENQNSNSQKKLSNWKKYHQGSQTEVKNLEKTVLRMSLGRKNRQINNEYQKRGYPKNVQSWDDYRKKQKKQYVEEEQKLRGYNTNI